MNDDEFYSKGLMEEVYKDPMKYRGRGRPRKIDYSPLSEFNKWINHYYEQLIMKRIYGN